MSSDATIDGGRNALLGFYYQMLIAVGLSSLAAEDINEFDDELLVLLKTMEAGSLPKEVVHEYIGQDVALGTEGRVQMLLQMKHSRNPVGKDMVVGIIRRFAESHLRTLKNGMEPVRNFVLVTNSEPRPILDRILESVLEARKRLLASSEKDEIACWKDVRIALSSTKNPLAQEQLKDWLTVKGSTGGIKLPSKKFLNAAEYVFPRLRFVFGSPIEEWRKRFDSFAKGYGSTPFEIKQGEQLLLGKLLCSGSSSVLCRADIVEALTGRPEASSLKFDDAGKVCAQEWKRKVLADGLSKAWMVTRGHATGLNLSDLSGPKVYFVRGHGGTGKTVLLTQIMEEAVGRLELGIDPRWFIAAGRCSDLDADWLERKVAIWGRRGTPGEAKMDKPLTRLSLANPDVKGLLLVVALDGLDEHCPSDAVLKRLLERVQSRDDIKLFFTCRTRDSARVEEYLFSSETGCLGVAWDPPPQYIEVQDFCDDELLDAIHLGFGDNLRDVVAQTLGKTHQAIGEMDNPVAHPAIVESLRHPRMLGSFVDLCSNDRILALSILGAEDSGLTNLAKEFLSRFFRKYRHREASLRLPESSAMADILQELVRSTVASSFTEQEWNTVSQNAAGLKKFDSRKVLHEGLSGGLFLEQNSQFIWRHDFLRSYLLASDVGDYCLV